MPTRKGVKGNSDSEVVPFHGLISITLVAGNASRQLSPSGLSAFLTRVAAEADSWAHFRWRQFKFRIHHGGTTGDVAVGYLGGVQDTGPTTSTGLCEVLSSTYYGSTYTRPSEWVKCSASELAGPFPWYKSINGTADTTEEAPGYLFICGSGTDSIVIEVRGVIEFKTAVAPANTPAAIKLREVARAEKLEKELAAARQSIVKILATTPPGGPKS